MSAPVPGVISRPTSVSVNHLQQCAYDYGFLYPSAYTKRRDGVGERVATRDDPDLSDFMVGEIAAYRRDIEAAARAMFEAERRIQIAQARLNDAALRMEARTTLEPEQHERAIAHPADAGDVKRATKAHFRLNERAVRRVFPWSRGEVAR